MTCLTNGIADVLTIDQFAQSLTHGVGFFNGETVEKFALNVEADVVGAEPIGYVELRIFFGKQGCDRIGRNGVDEVQIAVLISAVDGAVISREHELKTFDGYVFSIPVVGILYINHGLVMRPAFKHVRTRGGEASFQSPSARAEHVAVCIGVAVSRFNSSLLHREEGGECSQVHHVGARSSHHNGEGGAIFRSGHIQSIRIAFDAVEHVAVVSSGFGAGGTFPRIFEVSGSQIGAIRPFEIFTDGEDIGHAIFRNFVASCEVWNRHASFIVDVETSKGSSSQASAVNRAVQSRIEFVWFAGQAESQSGAVAIGNVMEEVRTKNVRVETFHGGFHHVGVVVVVERNDASAFHQDVFRFMHHGFALCEVGAGFDISDQLIILGPVWYGGSHCAACHGNKHHNSH